MGIRWASIVAVTLRMIDHTHRNDFFFFRCTYLLWLALTVVTCLPAFVPPFVALMVAALLVFVWIFVNISPKRLICTFLISVLQIFFREMVARNQFKVPPQNVPCIFVIAPHANQFIDPFVVMHAVGRMDLCYLTAAKSIRQRFVGLLARLIESIPVERSHDLAFNGTGEVWLSPEDRCTVIGRGTCFTKELKPRDEIYIGPHGPFRVVAVRSDDTLTIKELPLASAQPPPREAGGDALPTEGLLGGGHQTFRVVPYADQSAMFDAVHEALYAGKAVGIFPEGGSHDRPSLLPLSEL